MQACGGEKNGTAKTAALLIGEAGIEGALGRATETQSLRLEKAKIKERGRRGIKKKTRIQRGEREKKRKNEKEGANRERKGKKEEHMHFK